ncbi:hypothetical protein CEP54_005501 [Fusarium duplospermum]|uniref:Uncharacterized protein n=1 Tax=Fusarium duplospermum TaxID=1325734 RepID=A0A428QCG8_9HYPO|nr:hypothetical protein CEP54_005501 [Fusarium duplospermum]
MKLQSLAVLFSSAALAVSQPVCNERSELCKSLSKQDKSRSKENMKLETCLAPAHTVTSTRIIRPTSIVVITLQPAAVTKKVTQMTTETCAPVTPPTIAVTATDVDVGTITEADTIHATNFVTVTETETETEVATEIKPITETKIRTDPWSPPECDDRGVIGNKRELLQKSAQIPAECSCLLTATKGQEPVQTATATVTKPAVTLTVFKITLKSTLTRYAPGTTVPAPETTEIIIEHSTQTDHTLVTVTDDVTDIFTETET